MLIKFGITNEKAKQSFLFNIDGLDINIKENFVKFTNCLFLDIIINVISISDVSNVEITNCNFTVMHLSFY